MRFFFPPADVDKALLVNVAEIAGFEVAVLAEHFRGGLRVVVVAEHQGGGLDRDLADLVLAVRFPAPVYDLDIGVLHRQAHGHVVLVPRRADADERAVLAHAVAVDDVEAE
jgi:hypothetical protein